MRTWAQAGSLAEGGDIFVLDMGKPLKILELTKKMIILSGKKPVLENKGTACAGEIGIRVTGLRRGEKMFEELSYSYKLNRTQHPRIMSTVDSGLSGKELTSLLDATVDAMASDNYQELFSIIRQVCKGVANEKTSSDVFFQQS